MPILTGERDDYFSTPWDRLVLRAAYDMKIMLQSGFTAARDMTKISGHLKWAVENGLVEGPTIMPGGQVLSVTAGHGDADTNMPYELSRDTMTGFLMDGVEGCMKGVRQQFRQGAEFIKICATGGVSLDSGRS